MHIIDMRACRKFVASKFLGLGMVAVFAMSALADASGAEIQLYEKRTFSLLRTQRAKTTDFGLSSLAQQSIGSTLIFGVVFGFGEAKTREKVVAFETNTGLVSWSNFFDFGGSISFVSSSPASPVLAVGGRFSGPSAKANLALIDSTSGNLIRYLAGTEGLDVTSSHWIQNRILVSHATVTDHNPGSGAGRENGRVIVEGNNLEGRIIWHDLATGGIIRNIKSPLLEAAVIMQSSDDSAVVFAGYEGTAIVDVTSGKVLSFVHMSDLLGPEFVDCSNFGCGSSRSAFVGMSVSADLRLAVLSLRRGNIMVVDLQARKIIASIPATSPRGNPLFLRTLRLAPKNELYAFFAEEFTKPSKGYVGVYNIATGHLLRWHEGPEVLGECGGPVGRNVFSDDFQFLYSSDSANGWQDSRMLQQTALNIYQLN